MSRFVPVLALLVNADGTCETQPFNGANRIFSHDGQRCWLGYEIAHTKKNNKGEPIDGIVVYYETPIE